MSTYLMFGKYSAEGVKGISANRTKAAADLIKKSGGELVAIYALLGEFDLVLVARFPGTKEVVKSSLALAKLTGVSFSTAEAIPVEEFDKLAEA